MSQTTTNSPSFLRRGFTLIEMITVLTIIILVLAIAIPVWNALMGGTNLASAQNQISAFLATARADAVYNRQTIGVCFFIDPKTQRTAMAEVQTQSLYQTSTGTITPLYQPTDEPLADGSVYSLELVNNPDPNNPGNYSFYRDPVLLPAGVGVALDNDTFTWNQNNVWGSNPAPGPYPALDRYLHLGVIMFGPDGTLATIPFAIPLNDQFTKGSTAVENLLCQKVGMFYSTASTNDIASNVTPLAGNVALPLRSSVGLVIFDHDAYLTQHASLKVGASASLIGDGAAFNDWDMNYYLYTTNSYPNPVNPWNVNFSADKFIEEHWIDQNGTALMVSPFNGSLIKAK